MAERIPGPQTRAEVPRHDPVAAHVVEGRDVGSAQVDAGFQRDEVSGTQRRPDPVVRYALRQQVLSRHGDGIGHARRVTHASGGRGRNMRGPAHLGMKPLLVDNRDSHGVSESAHATT
ncbi:hypothetical protein [Rhodococcus rhodochrous]|uniref:hypothetical protein n=1 Tax=Rhodococcus rhodochrous TaxID=1829 RepID=UPI00187D82C8|nr:hypothetical protein [Rhodococcus rhodochrous]